MTYGRSVLFRVGSGIKVQASDDVDYKIGGVMLAWDTITAAASTYQLTPQGEQSTIDSIDSVIANGWIDVVEAGEKFIRFGTVVCKIIGGTLDGYYAPYGTSSGVLGGGVLSKVKGDVFILNESVHQADDSPKAITGGKLFKHRLVVNFAKAQNLALGGATGGTYTLSYKGQTTTALAFGANAATVQAALEALSTIGTGKVTVTGSAPFVITLSQSLAPFGDLTVTSSLTGGSSAAALTDAVDTLAGPSQAEFEALFPDVDTVNELN